MNWKQGRRQSMLRRFVLRLTEEHVSRAFRIARWYSRRAPRAEITDLESAALEGLAKAARDFDPNVPARRAPRAGGKRSFWAFAFKRILGEMRDELRRFDHLTRDQRALLTELPGGELTPQRNELSWINLQEPLSLDANVAQDDREVSPLVVDLIQEPRNPIEDLEVRDAFCRASEGLPERELFVLVKRELEGYSNMELARAFDVTEGRTSQLRGAALDRVRDHIGDSFLDAA
jgi:RNA polymerase sigma factor (sigma-70 family)